MSGRGGLALVFFLWSHLRGGWARGGCGRRGWLGLAAASYSLVLLCLLIGALLLDRILGIKNYDERYPMLIYVPCISGAVGTLT